ncbi:MAG: hypothetical protein GWN30_09235 [Gammaproteobacteria bacterium]|nr:hypothetical protein [Gammaproteobacteria bacterium]
MEGYLRDWEGAALIVSHDRYFLDRTCDHIWEMSGGRIEIYRGNYSHYLEQRQERTMGITLQNFRKRKGKAGERPALHQAQYRWTERSAGERSP